MKLAEQLQQITKEHDAVTRAKINIRERLGLAAREGAYHIDVPFPSLVSEQIHTEILEWLEEEGLSIQGFADSYVRISWEAAPENEMLHRFLHSIKHNPQGFVTSELVASEWLLADMVNGLKAAGYSASFDSITRKLTVGMGLNG